MARRFASLGDFVAWSLAQPVLLDQGEGPTSEGCHPAQRSRVWPRGGLNCWEATAHYVAVALALRAPVEVHVYDAPVGRQRHVFPGVRELDGVGRPEPVILQPPQPAQAFAVAQCVGMERRRTPACSAYLDLHAQGFSPAEVAQLRSNGAEKYLIVNARGYEPIPMRELARSGALIDVRVGPDTRGWALVGDMAAHLDIEGERLWLPWVRSVVGPFSGGVWQQGANWEWWSVPVALSSLNQESPRVRELLDRVNAAKGRTGSTAAQPTAPDPAALDAWQRYQAKLQGYASGAAQGAEEDAYTAWQRELAAGADYLTTSGGGGETAPGPWSWIPDSLSFLRPRRRVVELAAEPGRANAWYNDVLGGLHFAGDKALRITDRVFLGNSGIGAEISDGLAGIQGDATPDQYLTEGQRRQREQAREQERQRQEADRLRAEQERRRTEAEQERQAAEAQRSDAERQARELEQRAAQLREQAGKVEEEARAARERAVQLREGAAQRGAAETRIVPPPAPVMTPAVQTYLEQRRT